jgi:hypothetical protein
VSDDDYVLSSFGEPVWTVAAKPQNLWEIAIDNYSGTLTFTLRDGESEERHTLTPQQIANALRALAAFATASDPGEPLPMRRIEIAPGEDDQRDGHEQDE